jgi:hypothetical protein
MANLKRCYSASGSGISSAIRPIPRSVDDGPVGVVWMGSGSTEGGNHEHVLCDVTLDIWVQADNPEYAYNLLVQFPDLARSTFRSDMTLSGEVTRCQFTGWDEPYVEYVGDRTFLVLGIRLSTLIVTYS